MAIKQDAYARIEAKLKKQAGGDDAHKALLERREHLLRKQMGTADGREFLYEFVANSAMLSVEPYTGNADCYYILGEQATARKLLLSAKRTSLKLYHKMEAEGQQRDEARNKEEKR